MVGQSTKHELEIRAFVKDEMSKSLRALQEAVAALTKAVQGITSATAAQGQATVAATTSVNAMASALTAETAAATAAASATTALTVAGAALASTFFVGTDGSVAMSQSLVPLTTRTVAAASAVASLNSQIALASANMRRFRMQAAIGAGGGGGGGAVGPFLGGSFGQGPRDAEFTILGAGRAASTATGLFKGLAASVAGAAAGFIGVAAAITTAISVMRRLVTAIKDAAFEASRLARNSEEIRSAFGFTFGELAGQSQGQLEEFARTTGRFTDDLLDASVAFQLMLEPMVGVADQAADLSVLMTELGVDLGSFRNVAPDEALGRLQSALAGNTEALRTLVGFIAEADVQQAVYASGVADVGQELTNAEKTFGRVIVVVDRLKKAIGDAERTKDSFANTAIRLAAAFKDQLLPAGQQINRALLDMLQSMGGVETFGKAVGLAARDMAGALSFVFSVIELAGPSVRGLVETLAALDSGLSKVGETIRSKLKSGVEGVLERIASQSEEASLAISVLSGVINGIKAPELEDTSSFDGFMARLDEMMTSWREQLEAVRALAEAEEQRQATLKFSVDLADKMRSLELQTAETVQQRIRAEQAIYTANVARVVTEAQELGIAEKISGELDQYVALMQVALRLRIEAVQEAEKERLQSEKAKALQEEANRQLRDNAIAIGGLQSGVDNFASAIGSIASGAQTASEAFSNMARNIIGDIASMIARMAALRLAFTFANAAGFGAGFNQALGTNFLLEAKGDAFHGGNVVPFAKGGVVTGPTIFPMARGAGIMGEAGPEGVVPLERMRGGKLGVNTTGSGSGASITFGQGSIVVVAAPGQSERSIAEAVIHQLTTNPQFISAINGAGRA